MLNEVGRNDGVEKTGETAEFGTEAITVLGTNVGT